MVCMYNYTCSYEKDITSGACGWDSPIVWVWVLFEAGHPFSIDKAGNRRGKSIEYGYVTCK